jgi:hypothetical protein
LSYAFPSESYIINNIKDKNINLLKREGTQIINDEGEVIGVNNVSDGASNLEKPPTIDNFYWINSNHFQKKKIIEQWKNLPKEWRLPSRSSTEEDADRRNIKRVRISRDDDSPDDEFIGTHCPSFNFCHSPPIIVSEDIFINDNKSPHAPLVDANHIHQCNLINPSIPLGEDNFICSETDVIHSVIIHPSKINIRINNTVNNVRLGAYKIILTQMYRRINKITLRYMICIHKGSMWGFFVISRCILRNYDGM